jgi:hypothetical protein
MTKNARCWLVLATVCAAVALAGCAAARAPADRPSPPAAADQRPAQLAPHRAPSKTMEVWIAAWEDARGDLHAPSTVYVEVDPTRWTYGDGSGSGRYTVLRPLQVERRPPPTDGPGTGIPEPAERMPASPVAGRRGI